MQEPGRSPPPCPAGGTFARAANSGLCQVPWSINHHGDYYYSVETQVKQIVFPHLQMRLETERGVCVCVCVSYLTSTTTDVTEVQSCSVL